MPSLYAYRKVIDTVTTHMLRLPDAAQGDQSGQELATLADGRTVVVIFDGYLLPSDQPAAIASSSVSAIPAWSRHARPSRATRPFAPCRTASRR